MKSFKESEENEKRIREYQNNADVCGTDMDISSLEKRIEENKKLINELTKEGDVAQLEALADALLA